MLSRMLLDLAGGISPIIWFLNFSEQRLTYKYGR